MKMTHKTYTSRTSYVCTGMILLGFVLLGALYIYGINEAAVHTFGKDIDSKRLAALEEELHILETDRVHLAVGSWLEDRAHQYALQSGGEVHFLTRDTSVARVDN